MKIEVTQSPNPADLQTISSGLQSHNAQYIGDVATEEEIRFSVFAKDENGRVVGGTRAVGTWNWLNIEVIWVDEEARGAGVGRRLLTRTEEFAMKSGFYSVLLETTSFQAREFYEKQGYAVFGKLDDYPEGHTMYYMKKTLFDI